MLLRRVLLPFLLALVLAPSALASGGNYVFDGGTRGQQTQVRSALNASSFDWGVVPGPVVIHIGKGDGPHATAGEIWLDGSLLSSGRFSWGVVQHEYAHQVDFAVLTDAMRGQLHALLGGSSWWGSDHQTLDCERFADLVAWSYWQSPENVMKPDSATDEGGQVAPPRFRAVLDSLLRPVRVTASVKAKQPHPKG
jgi:hypothetical protein